MKHLYIILLILPLIGFGQLDLRWNEGPVCWEEPVFFKPHESRYYHLLSSYPLSDSLYYIDFDMVLKKSLNQKIKSIKTTHFFSDGEYTEPGDENFHLKPQTEHIIKFYENKMIYTCGMDSIIMSLDNNKNIIDYNHYYLSKDTIHVQEILLEYNSNNNLILYKNFKNTYRSSINKNGRCYKIDYKYDHMSNLIEQIKTKIKVSCNEYPVKIRYDEEMEIHVVEEMGIECDTIDQHEEWKKEYKYDFMNNLLQVNHFSDSYLYYQLKYRYDPMNNVELNRVQYFEKRMVDGELKYLKDVGQSVQLLDVINYDYLGNETNNGEIEYNEINNVIKRSTSGQSSEIFIYDSNNNLIEVNRFYENNLVYIIKLDYEYIIE